MRLLCSISSIVDDFESFNSLISSHHTYACNILKDSGINNNFSMNFLLNLEKTNTQFEDLHCPIELTCKFTIEKVSVRLVISCI